MADFVRYQSIVPNRRGLFPGVFALANGLMADSMLTETDAAWVRSSNARATATYVDPTSVNRSCYDSTLNPGAQAWFRNSAIPLLDLAREYLDLLDRYGLRWVELRTASPGRLVYEDDVQVVAVPYSYAEDWPFTKATS